MSIIPIISNCLFKTILIKNPLFRNKLIALCLDKNIEEIACFKVSNPVINIMYSNQKESVVDFILKNKDKFINLEAYTYYCVTNIVKNLNYCCGIFWHNSRAGNSYKTTTEVIQICFNEHDKIGNKLINVDYLPITLHKNYNQKAICYINVNLVKLNNIEYTKNENPELIRYLKILVAKDEQELNKLCNGNKILEGVERMVNNYSNNSEYLASYTIEEERRAIMNSEIEIAKNDGIEKGIEKGMNMGRDEEKKNTAKAMLKEGLSSELIHKITGLPIKIINNITF